MPSDYKLSTGPGDGSGIAVGAFTLADGAVSLILPSAWRLVRERFHDATFAIPDCAGAEFSVELKTFDDQAAIRSNDLARYVNHPEFPPLDERALDRVRDERGVPDFEKLTVRAGGTSTDPDRDGERKTFRMWRKLGLLMPGHIRVIEAQLKIPERLAQSDAAQELEPIVDHLLKFTKFADHETGADRIAASKEMKSVTLWDTIYFRVPANWPKVEHENNDGTGMYVFDEKERDRWTLWIDYKHLADKRGQRFDIDVANWARQIAEPLQDRPKMRGVWVDPMPERPHEAVIKCEFDSVENGVKLRHISWQKLMNHDGQVFLGQFTWVVSESALNDPDIVALTATVEREVRNAVLFPS